MSNAQKNNDSDLTPIILGGEELFKKTAGLYVPGPQNEAADLYDRLADEAMDEFLTVLIDKENEG